MVVKINQRVAGNVKAVQDKITAILPKHPGKKIGIYIGGVVVLIGIIIAIVVYHHNQTKIHKPVYFYPNPHHASEFIEKPGSDIYINPAPYSFTWHMFIYVPNWKYRYGFEKEIISKGNGYDACPSIHLGSTDNNVIIRVKTTGGVEKLRVTDVAIRKWFHLTIVVQDLRMESYLDGRLENTLIMKHVIQTNNDPLYIARNGGFAGYIYRLCYLNEVLPPLTIQHISSQSPPTKQLKKLFS